jgi:quercetin dioxygenase-like cupin family protein
MKSNIFFGDNAMISIVEIEPDTAGKMHSHPEEQWGICQSGHGIRIQDGVRVVVKAGDFWLTPGGIKHGMEAGDEGMMVVDVFAPPRASYKTAGSGFSGAEE